MRRHLGLLRQLLTYRSPEPLQSAEELLGQAQRRMQELHARNRERAVAAIEHKNNLRAQVASLEARAGELEAKAGYAERKGQHEVARSFRSEKQGYEKALSALRETLAEADDAAEQVKLAIKREEELVREKTAQTLALKAQWKQAAVQGELEKQLKDAGLWVWGQPQEPELDLKTARELIFLLAVVAVLLVALLLR
jgi:phage shock protein A